MASENKFKIQFRLRSSLGWSVKKDVSQPLQLLNQNRITVMACMTMLSSGLKV